MKQSDPLELVDAGSLARPGPIGRLVRIVLGTLCLYAFAVLFLSAELTTAQPLSSLDNRVLIILVPLCVFNYVVNIGFLKSWGYKPLIASVVVLGLFATLAFVLTDSFDSPILGTPLNLWLAYFYGHLGISFVLAAIIATPGCEMRAISELLGRMKGEPAKEHFCPAAFITKIDEWESERF